MRRPFIFLLIPVLFTLMNLAPSYSQPSLKVGTLIPFTGRWAEAGRECARGMQDAGRWINQRGGVFGRKVEIFLVNDTFQTTETIAAYRKFNEVDRILLLHIYSSETAQTLLPHIHYTRIPTLVSFAPSPLMDPSKYPYLFSILPTPLDLAKIGATFISEKSGIKERKPKIVFLGSSDYLDQHFLDEARAYARNVGLEVVADAVFTDFSQAPSDAALPRQISSVLSSIQRSNADFAYVSLTSKEASSLLKEAGKSGSKMKWICNSRAFDETLVPYEGVLGVQPLSYFGDGIPGMAEIKEAHQRWHPYDAHTLFYVEGWATVQVIAETLGRALPEQQLSRERIKSSLESFRNHLLGGLIPPLTITSEDHRPSLESRVLIIKDGKIATHSSFISIARERSPFR
jgi:branched-chain amino acid transport system substrate-binding protein